MREAFSLLERQRISAERGEPKGELILCAPRAQGLAREGRSCCSASACGSPAPTTELALYRRAVAAANAREALASMPRHRPMTRLGWRAFPLVNGPTRLRNLGLNFFKADVASAQFFVTDEPITEHHFFLSTDRPRTCDRHVPSPMPALHVRGCGDHCKMDRLFSAQTTTTLRFCNYVARNKFDRLMVRK